MKFQPDIIKDDFISSEKRNLLDFEQIQERTAQDLAEIFKVLGDPTRIKVLYLLRRKEHCVGELSAALNMSQSAISHHLRLLRNLKLTKCKKIGKKVFYSLADEHVSKIFDQGLEHVLE